LTVERLVPYLRPIPLLISLYTEIMMPTHNDVQGKIVILFPLMGSPLPKISFVVVNDDAKLIQVNIADFLGIVWEQW